MHVDAVADDLRSDFVTVEDGADEAGIPMTEPAHPVEQVRRMTRAGCDRGERLLVVGAGVPERHAVTVPDEPGNQFEDAIDLGRDGDDPDVGTRALDLARGCSSPENSPSMTARGRTDAASGCAPLNSGLMKLLSRCAGSTRALLPGGLERAHADASRNVRSTRRVTGDRRRAEGGDAVPRQAPRNARDCVESLERIDAGNSVHVDVHETGNDVVVVKRGRRPSRGS